VIQTIRNAFTIPDLRKKILYTILIVFIFRIGTAIPVPFIDAEALKEMMKTVTDAGDTGNIISYLNMLSGRAFENATLFAMGIGPYITAQIIIQLLTVAIPPLEKMAKEGAEGRKKLNNIIRATTIGLGVFQGAMYFLMLKSNNVVFQYKGWQNTFVSVFIVTCFCAGTALVMWLGEQINKKGIGNGISILLFTGIVASGPKVFNTLRLWWKMAREGSKGYYFAIPGMVIGFLLIIWFIVFMQNSERRVTVQYAKRVQGRKMIGGQKTFIPIKVNMSGVMPIIFASTIISVPATVKMLVFRGKEYPKSFWYKVWSVFDSNSLLYAFIYFLLIIAFAYFYVTIQYNPIEIANNLHKNNGAIPGIRPGKNTIAYLSKIINRITLIGALFLSVVAVLPIVISFFTKVNISFGGTSVLILVGVALETVSQIESQMLMRHYKGFLD